MAVTNEYIISQIFTIISYLFLGLTYSAKERKRVLTLSFLSQIILVVAYVLLEAWTGLAMVMIAVTRNIIFIIDENKNGKRNNMNTLDIVVLIILFIIAIVFGVFTYKGFFSLFSVFETMLYTYSVCQKNVKVYKMLGIPTEIMCVIYNIFIKSLFGIILESAILIACSVGYAREIKLNSKPIKPVEA